MKPTVCSDNPNERRMGPDLLTVEQGMRWNCMKCGRCCNHVSFPGWIDDALADELNSIIDGVCGFLGKDNMCVLYDRRPNACRRYPFVISKEGDDYILKVHSKCRGIGEGSMLDVSKTILKVLRSLEEDLGYEFIVREKGGGHGRFDFYRI